MQIGTYMRELSRLRYAVVICLLIATFGGLSAYYKIGLFPPSLHPRDLEMATASTQVLVDTPSSTVLDLQQDTFSFQAMTNRTVLLGNIMASAPVIAYIGRRAGIPPEDIQAATPLTPDFPRPFSEVGREKHTSDLLRSSDQYRLSIHANPTVPILSVLAEAPTPATAQSLANASVVGLRDYLASVAAKQKIAPKRRVTLEQLGRAHGKLVNGGARLQAAFVFFLVDFALAAGVLLFISRVRRGWRGGRREGTATTTGQRPFPPPHSPAEERDYAIR
jgi:hypothetical protein